MDLIYFNVRLQKIVTKKSLEDCPVINICLINCLVIASLQSNAVHLGGHVGRKGALQVFLCGDLEEM